LLPRLALLTPPYLRFVLEGCPHWKAARYTHYLRKIGHIDICWLDSRDDAVDRLEIDTRRQPYQTRYRAEPRHVVLAMIPQNTCDTSSDEMLFPVEILSRIFRVACCTDVRFHLTLRRVSRLCRDIARPLKYCSMFIQGPEQLHVIVQQLAQYPANISLVEHVALTNHNHSLRRDTPGHKSKPWPDRHPSVQMSFTARPDGSAGNWIHDNLESVFVHDIRAFFDMIAPTLRTLHVSFYWPNLAMYSEIFHPKSSRTYPQLEELAYRGANDMWPEVLKTSAKRDGIIPAVETVRTTFPQLRRLWFSGPPNYQDYIEQDLLSDLAISCPGLTHLRLHEQTAYGFQSFLARFMRWHGVQIGERTQMFPYVMGNHVWDQEQSLDIVAVLQTNALIGFPHLQRLIIDLVPKGHHRSRTALKECDREVLHAVARRRREVVIRWCPDCTPRGRARLPFVRDLFERSVSGDSELWSPENELFQEEEAKRWQPIRVCSPFYRQLIGYRAHIPVSWPENHGWPAWLRDSQKTDDFE